MRIAYVSPMPPQRTGIADYSAALLPYLMPHFERMDLFTPETDVIAAVANVFPLVELPARWRTYDFCLYHIGNVADYHGEMYQLALQYPGIVVLHDFFLHHLVSGLTLGAGDLPAYLREMAYAAGAEGVARAYRAAEDWNRMPLFEMPLNERLLDVSLGVMVHSRYALRDILARRPQMRVAYIPAPFGPETPEPLTRVELGLPEDAFIVTVSGMPNAAKRTELLLHAVAGLLDDLPELRCLFVGDLLKEQALPNDPALRDRLLSLGYIPSLRRFLAYLQASDVIVNLRFPTVGESSALTLRALALAKPVIVSNAGWYADLPDEGCMKLTHTGDFEADAQILAEYLVELAHHPETRARMGVQGQAYVQREHHSTQVARAYWATLNAWRTIIYG